MSGRRSFRVCSVVVVAVMLVGSLAVAETFKSDEGRFRVSVPVQPKLEKLTLKTAAGPIEISNYTAETKEGAYILGYFDLPTGVPDAEKIDEVLDGAANGMIANTKGTRLMSTRITVAGFPGYEVDWSLPVGNAEARAHARLVLVGARMYQIFVLGREPFVKSRPALDYVRSLEFDPAPGIKPPPKKPAPKAAPARPAPARPPAPAPAPAPTATSTPVDRAAQWRPFSAKNNDGGYTVEMPAKPERSQAPGILGVRNRTVFSCSAEGLTFAIMGQPIPAAAQNDGEASLLNTSRDALASAHNGKVTKDQSVKIGEFSAREFRITSASLRPNAILARTVVAGRRLYTLYVLGPETALSGPSAHKFLQSFTPLP